METRSLMSLDEYLHTSFDDADREYVDGEVIERNMGELPHAVIQTELTRVLLGFVPALKIRVLTEIRIQVSPMRFRVADVAVWRAGDISQRIPTVPPFLVVEILLAEDRLVRLQPKIQEYLQHGTEWVWVIDPEERRALSYSPVSPGGTLIDTLTTENPAIAVPLTDLLSVLP